jgi:tRNA dimethylallyltransferase
VSVDEEYSLGQFLLDLERELESLRQQERQPLFVGGTALWIRAVVNGFRPPRGSHGVRLWLEARLLDELDDRSAYHLLGQLDPAAAAGVDPRNRRRLVRALEVTLASGGQVSVAGDQLGTSAPQRFPQIGLTLAFDVLEQRIRSRVEEQIAQGWIAEVATALTMHPSRTARAAIGVTELERYLAGATSLELAIEAIVRRTRRLAKRQLAWLRRDTRIEWVSGIEEGLAVVERLLAVAPNGPPLRAPALRAVEG